MFIPKLEEYHNYFSNKKSGWFLLSFVATTLGIGLIILSSASLSFTNQGGYYRTQLIWSGIAFIFLVLGGFIDLNFLKKRAEILLVIFFSALLMVLIPGIGKLVNGSRRWLSLGGINFQVSEFTKIVIIIWLAQYLERNKTCIKKFWEGFLLPLFIIGIICCLIFAEPDYGTAMLIGSVALTLLFLAGTHILYLISALICGCMLISGLIYLNPERMSRIVAFLDIDKHKFDVAYQLWQSILGFASGGLYGCGLGQGRQQAVYLPEAHTDFIFAVVGEELGGLTASAILVLYAIFFLTSYVRAQKIDDIFIKFLALGISFMITYQVVINIGVVTGLLPTKGMVLPFISYGGSSLVVLFFMIGILLNCFSRE